MAEPTHNDDSTGGQDSSRSKTSSVIRRLSQGFGHSQPHQGLAAVAGDVASSVFSGRTQLDEQVLAPLTGRKDATSQIAERTAKRAGSPEDSRPSDVGDTPVTASEQATLTGQTPRALECTEPFENGYHFPPKYSWAETIRHGLKAFWNFFLTPMGFFWTVYGLNVVAWGGMLFLLLCNASPAMCYPTCDDINSPRRKWIEWDSQILTGLFCVTAFGLAPWRFRDLYYLLQYRVSKNYDGLRRLAGIHNGWFRLRGTEELAPDVGPGNIPDGLPSSFVPIPEKNMPKAPLTGTRAPATAVWKLDLVIWSMVWNTFAQCALCGIMWGMNRYDRPSWATGFLVAIACIIAMVGGLVMFLEGKKVKSIEGVPLTERDLEKLARDKELGIPHYNNIKDKKPKDRGRADIGK
ncbi:uncharacterized protein THITE_2119296 [Thermothielavioides terrestris NRRL 8126]|uniref:Uncharacterized protein n=1 Tax=Thermothielavioides terrestris (strain ATCC 38088 / NRRL 8126) TaxID=578455 RepID=G2RBK9_THETT|nr:uncharacterized protein THITE_2119296 [Thermothielavioides terrestris NRRL 8126]AEO69180.1 hypothetical protein THITE_2119296 [Thermothielavioides terrestris NRRL 8126]